MLTEEQIQRLAKIAVDELDYDENKAEKEIRLAANLANFAHKFLSLFGYEEIKENAGRYFEEKFFRRQLKEIKKKNGERRA